LVVKVTACGERVLSIATRDVSGEVHPFPPFFPNLVSLSKDEEFFLPSPVAGIERQTKSLALYYYSSV